MRITQLTVRTATPKDRPYEIRDSQLPGFILRVQPSGIQSYIVEYARGKRVTLGRTAAKTLTQARDEAVKILNDYTAGREVMPPRKKTQILDKSSTLDDFLIHHYAEYCKKHHSRPNEAIGRIRRGFKKLLSKPLARLTKLDVENIRDKRLEVGFKPATVARDVAMLKGVFSEAVRIGLVEKHPLKGIRQPKLDKSRIVRFLSDDEERRIMVALDGRERLKVMILISLHTGVRFGELAATTWPDVSLENETLTIHGHNAKSGQTRHVPLNAVAVETFKDWKRRSTGTRVFPGKSGDRLDNVRKSWLSVLREADIRDFRWHDLRHTFASRLVMAGADLNDVRELLGHGSIAMTLRYAHLSPKHKNKIVRLLEKERNE